MAVGPYNLTEIKTVDRDAYWPKQKEVLRFEFVYSGADKTVYSAVWPSGLTFFPGDEPERRTLAQGEKVPEDNWFHRSPCDCRLCRPERD